MRTFVFCLCHLIKDIKSFYLLLRHILLLSYLLIGLDCLLDLADLGHVELQQVHTDAAVSKRYFFAPAAI